MARKTLSRKELRQQADAAAQAETGKKKKATKPRATRRKSQSAAKQVRLKAFWGVFSQSMKRVALFEYGHRDQAEKKASDLTESQKTPHFVQLVKEVIEE